MKRDLSEDDSKEPNTVADPNGWFRYQRLVLQQIEDHGLLLQSLIKEINEFKEKRAAQIAEFQIWKANIEDRTDKLETKVTHILYEEGGIGHILRGLQQKLAVEETASTKVKAIWAIYGAVIVFIINVVLQLVGLFKN